MINEDALYEQIGKRLKTLRLGDKNRQLTQEKLADSVSLERTSITNIEAGKQRVPLHVLYELCNALNIEISEVLPRYSEISVEPKPETVTLGDLSYSVSSQIADLVRTTK